MKEAHNERRENASMVLIGYISGVAALVSLYCAGRCYKHMKDTERGHKIAITVSRDLARLHEQRAEMYRAFLIERQTKERTFTAQDEVRMYTDTFGGPR